MGSLNLTRTGRTGRRAAAAAAITAFVVSGCSGQNLEQAYLPIDEATTSDTPAITDLWVGSWIAAMAVGVLVWGLTIWCVVAYRRRKDETGLPAQVRYNLPLELLYTFVPFLIIGVLFYYTLLAQNEIEELPEPDHRVTVVGKQWSWDFNYTDEDVYDTGVQAALTGETGVPEQLPQLWLPVGERVELRLQARDVIHSFWVPEFLYKKDTIPGRTNFYSFVPVREGVYDGKCAEFCGEYHSEMLFRVNVVSRAEYDEYIEALRDAGQTGELPVEAGPYPPPDDEQYPGNPYETDPDNNDDDSEGN